MADKVSIDGCPRIDAFLLHRRGALVDGVTTKWEWPLPIGTTTITARADGHRLFLAVNGGAEVAHTIVPKVGTTGNSYAFFECSACEGSGRFPTTRFLYVRNGRVACRDCSKLVWSCRMPSKCNAVRRRLNRARANLVTIEMELLRLRREGGLKST